jgi:hypothetical protein
MKYETKSFTENGIHYAHIWNTNNDVVYIINYGTTIDYSTDEQNIWFFTNDGTDYVFYNMLNDMFPLSYLVNLKTKGKVEFVTNGKFGACSVNACTTKKYITVKSYVLGQIMLNILYDFDGNEVDVKSCNIKYDEIIIRGDDVFLSLKLKKEFITNCDKYPTHMISFDTSCLTDFDAEHYSYDLYNWTTNTYVHNDHDETNETNEANEANVIIAYKKLCIKHMYTNQYKHCFANPEMLFKQFLTETKENIVVNVPNDVKAKLLSLVTDDIKLVTCHGKFTLNDYTSSHLALSCTSINNFGPTVLASRTLGHTYHTMGQIEKMLVQSGIGLVFNIITTKGTFVYMIEMNLVTASCVDGIEYVKCDDIQSVIHISVVQT